MMSLAVSRGPSLLDIVNLFFFKFTMLTNNNSVQIRQLSGTFSILVFCDDVTRGNLSAAKNVSTCAFSLLFPNMCALCIINDC